MTGQDLAGGAACANRAPAPVRDRAQRPNVFRLKRLSRSFDKFSDITNSLTSLFRTRCGFTMVTDCVCIDPRHPRRTRHDAGTTTGDNASGTLCAPALRRTGINVSAKKPAAFLILTRSGRAQSNTENPTRQTIGHLRRLFLHGLNSVAVPKSNRCSTAGNFIGARPATVASTP